MKAILHWDLFFVKSISLDMEQVEFSFPPSANWYQTQALDVSSQGIMAYGSMKECVVLYPVINAGKIIHHFIFFMFFDLTLHES